MKRKLLFPILFVVLALASCKKDDSGGGMDSKQVTFNVSTPEPSSKLTKVVDVDRYIMAIYNVDDPTTVIHHIEQTGGTFILPLDNNTSYVCLFWADQTAANDNANGTYNATDLKNVTLNTGKAMEEAFFARLDVVDDETTFNVVLKRPTAQVNLVENDLIAAASNIVVTHDHYNSFNAFSSDVMGTPVSKDITIAPTVTTGVLGSYLTFAPVVGTTKDFATVYNTTVSNSIPNVPLKANHITNIRGSYAGGSQVFTFIIAIDDVWEEEASIGGVAIKIGNGANATWIKVADRNADINGTYGATIGNSSTDFGSYYTWSNASNNPNDVDKSYNACYDFGEGSGAWRMMTDSELQILNGNNGSATQSNSQRKMQYEDGVWKLYDERPGFEDNFVYFPLAGVFANGNLAQVDQGYYWSSTINGISVRALVLGAGDTSHITNYNVNSNDVGFTVRCVRDM